MNSFDASTRFLSSSAFVASAPISVLVQRMAWFAPVPGATSAAFQAHVDSKLFLLLQDMAGNQTILFS